jgi:hypothetical protein
MSDTSQQTTVVASAQQALAIQDLNEDVVELRKKITTLWVVVIIVGVIALAGAVLTILPRFGVRVGGGGFPSGRLNQQNFQTNGGPGGTGGTGGQTAPSTGQ